MTSYLINKSDEEILLENFPIPIDIKGMNDILEQMKTNVCKIYKNNGEKATGFFCTIIYESHRIPVLMTNNHVIDEEYIKINEFLNIRINDDQDQKTIRLKNKNYYCSEKYDTTIIELSSKDDINNFLEIDEKIYFPNSNDCYIKESVYIIQYQKNHNVLVSYGIIKELNEYDINHCCSTEKGSSGSPIISIKSKKIIGIHKEGKEKFDFNMGTFLKYPILEFIEKISKNNNNNYLEKKTTPSFLLDNNNTPQKNLGNNNKIENNNTDITLNESSLNKDLNINIFNKDNSQIEFQNISILPKIENNISKIESSIEIDNKYSPISTKNTNFFKYYDQNLSYISREKNIKSNQNPKNFNSRNGTFINYSHDKFSKISTYDKNENSVFIWNNSYSQPIIPKPGLVGLSNKKYPFSLNSIIHCLGNVIRLRKYLLSKKNYEHFLYKKNEGMKLTFELSKILKNIWENKEIISKRIYDSSQLKAALSNEFNKKKSNDNPVEAIKILLSSIDTELKKKNQNNLSTQKNNNININNFNQVYNNKINQFNNNKTIISKEFGIIQKSEIFCNSCEKKVYDINQIYNLVFNIEEVIKFLNNKKEIIINDCFYFFNSYKQEQKYFCEKCKNWKKVYIKKSFISLPGTMIFCLINSIERHKIKIKENFNCSTEDQSEFCYALIGVIVENSKQSYISYCKNSQDNKWYKYNNEKIVESSFSEISDINFPLILFYSANNKFS